MDRSFNIDRNLNSNNPRWSWWDLFLVILTLVIILSFVALLRKPIRQGILSAGIAQAHLQTVLLFITTFIQASAIVGAVIVITRRKGAGLRELGLIDSNLIKHIGTGIIGGLFLGAAIWFSGIIISLLLGPPPPQDVEKILSGVNTGQDTLLPFIAISVLAPISEEIYFRGMVYPVVRARFGPVMGMALSGMFFGLMHFDLYRFIPLSLGGFVLAFLFEKTKTLSTPITAHFTWNTLMLFSFFFLTGH